MSNSSFTILSVLVVEDDALVRMHGMDILEDAGFNVLEASNADDALVILSGGAEVHLLLSDVDMPGSIDGVGLARVVRERWPEVHLLLTSGHHRLADGDLPPTGRFIRKPWTADGLLGQVRALVEA